MLPSSACAVPLVVQPTVRSDLSFGENMASNQSPCSVVWTVPCPVQMLAAVWEVSVWKVSVWEVSVWEESASPVLEFGLANPLEAAVLAICFVVNALPAANMECLVDSVENSTIAPFRCSRRGHVSEQQETRRPQRGQC